MLPFAFSPELELIVDPSLLTNDELYFNAARLDRSMVLKTRDYVALARPRIGRIAESRGCQRDSATRGDQYRTYNELSDPPARGPR